MASSLVLESRGIANNVKLHEDFEGIDVEVLEINSSILKSLLEDAQGDDQDYDQLNDVIRSLEAEIDPSSLAGHDLGTHTKVINDLVAGDENSTINSRGRDGSRDWSEYSSDDFSWIDMDTVPSSPGEGMDWYMEEFGDEMNCLTQFGCIGDYYQYPQVYSSEEPAYGSLWHETSHEMME
ncbi:hypothetical protein CDL15_Pgr007051 [Punica granatum]|uniref:Uncharacterized protein n=1 Tax=Punica granatum TaxID=22663 RepID=A0A218X8H6_PUNGR|nr:hypothetical protein CDL15_Pgr007051 [Punica granatum]PKI35861.1 hypothetical protein CRG98_043770 [Punica granatum]